MTRDPIVEEIRAVREQIARENNHDLATIFTTLRWLEAESKRPHVRLEPRKVQATRAADG